MKTNPSVRVATPSHIPSRDGQMILLGDSNPAQQEFIDTQGWEEFHRRYTSKAIDAGAKFFIFRMPGSHLYFDGASIGIDLLGWRKMVDDMLARGVEPIVYVRAPHFLSPGCKLSWQLLRDVMSPFEGCSIGFDALAVCDPHPVVDVVESIHPHVYTEAWWHRGFRHWQKFPTIITEEYYKVQDLSLVPDRLFGLPERIRNLNTLDDPKAWAADCRAKGHSRAWMVFPGTVNNDAHLLSAP
ncbi:MAG: hypothetical protein IT435_02570 [Phycisphaerales bacterium]|nr:hypothetical protein [Phycisphaerales bacterium]